MDERHDGMELGQVLKINASLNLIKNTFKEVIQCIDTLAKLTTETLSKPNTPEGQSNDQLLENKVHVVTIIYEA